MPNQDLIDYMNSVITQTNENIVSYQSTIDSNITMIGNLNDENTFLGNIIAQFQQNIVWATAIIALIPPDAKS